MNDSLKTNFRKSDDFVPFHVQPRCLDNFSSSSTNTIDTNDNDASDTPHDINKIIQ